MINTQNNNQTNQTKFITELSSYLTHINNEMIESFVLWELLHPENSNKFSDGFPTIYWNCQSLKLTTEPVVGETYFLFNFDPTTEKFVGEDEGKFFCSVFKKQFKIFLKEFKDDLLNENRNETFIFGHINNVYVCDDTYLYGCYPLEILSENQLRKFFLNVFENFNIFYDDVIEKDGQLVKKLSHYQKYVDDAITTLRLGSISYFLSDDDKFEVSFKRRIVDVLLEYDKPFQTKFYNDFLNELLKMIQNTNKKFSKEGLEVFISDLSKLSKVCEHFNSETVSEIIKTVAEQGLPQLSVVGISNLVLMIEDFDLNVCDFIQTYELKTFISYDTIQEFLDNNYCGDFDLCDCIFHIQQATLSKLKINLRKTEVINPLHFFDGILSFVLSFSEREENSEKVKFILTEELLPHLKLLQENPQLLVSKVCSEEEVRKAFEYFVKN